MEGRVLKYYSFIFMLFVLVGTGCARIPASVDLVEYERYNKILATQNKEHCNLIGLYRLNSAIEKLVDTPDKATPTLGDFKFAAIERGGSIQFISLSGFGNFGIMSDQGPGFTVNLQGVVYWLFAANQCTASGTHYLGKFFDVFANTEGQSILTITDGWYKIQNYYEEQTNNGKKKTKDRTFFLTRIEQ